MGISKGRRSRSAEGLTIVILFPLFMIIYGLFVVIRVNKKINVMKHEFIHVFSLNINCRKLSTNVRESSLSSCHELFMIIYGLFVVIRVNEKINMMRHEFIHVFSLNINCRKLSRKCP